MTEKVRAFLSPPPPSGEWGERTLDEMRSHFEIEITMEAVNASWWILIPQLHGSTLRYKLGSLLHLLDGWAAWYQWDQYYPYAETGPQPPDSGDDVEIPGGSG